MNYMRLLILLLFSTTINAASLSEIIGDRTEPVIIGDKTNGKVFVYNPAIPSVVSSNALFGKTISDSFIPNDYDYLGKAGTITPAGEFKSHKYISAKLKTPITAFVEGKTSFVAIHPVWLGIPSQKRLERLASNDIVDNRITNGCVNVSPDFYSKSIVKLLNETKVVILKEGDKLIDDVSGTLVIGNKIVVEQQKVTSQYGVVIQSEAKSLAGSAGFAGLD
jgi:hypothetical protein